MSKFWILLVLTTPLFAETPSRNPFKFDEVPVPVIETTQPKTVQSPRNTKPKEPTFVWHIQGIFQTETGNMALLNYRFVCVGDVIQGWMVIEIRAKTVTLKKDAKELSIKLDD